MFDFDISLFMFSMRITISNYLDSSPVSIEFRCMHTYMSESLLSFLVQQVWRTKLALRTGRRWMYEQKAQKVHTTPNHVNRQTDKECAWGRPRLLQKMFIMLFLRSFVTCHEWGTAWLFHVGLIQKYCVSHLSSRRSDYGLTIQESCSQDKPNMRAGAQEDTPEVVGRHHSIVRI